MRDLRLRSVRTRTSPGERAPCGDSGALRPARGPGLREASRTSTRRCRGRDELVDGVPVRDLPSCREKVYLVQDHELSSTPRRSNRSGPSETYEMGYRCLAYTPWIAGVLREQYGLEVAQFDCGTDPRRTLRRRRRAGTGLDRRLRARRDEPARGRARDRRDWRRSSSAGRTNESCCSAPAFRRRFRFRAENIGVVSPAELAALYRRASVGLVFSLTNLSLVTKR